jgi:Cytochrome bd terminal oxidase subunit I
MLVLAAAAIPGDLRAARTQMAVSLGWHIIIACLGVGFPLLVLFAEWRWIRTGEEVWRLLARRWARALGVLFAVGAVSGTILSFELAAPEGPHAGRRPDRDRRGRRGVLGRGRQRLDEPAEGASIWSTGG